MYNWPNVAQRTVAVYDKLASLPSISPQAELLSRLRRYRAIGTWAGLIFCCIMVWLHCFCALLEWQQPVEGVDMAVDWPSVQQQQQRQGEESKRKMQKQQDKQQQRQDEHGQKQEGGGNGAVLHRRARRV
jgi:hypothetical protein